MAGVWRQHVKQVIFDLVSITSKDIPNEVGSKRVFDHLTEFAVAVEQFEQGIGKKRSQNLPLDSG